jgi:hypothetical protein
MPSAPHGNAIHNLVHPVPLTGLTASAFLADSADAPPIGGCERTLAGSPGGWLYRERIKNDCGKYVETHL